MTQKIKYGERRAYLQAMGIDLWVSREAGRADRDEHTIEAPGDHVAPSKDVQEEVAVAGLDWSGLAARVAACAACELHRTRTQTVFGVGDREANWMIIGEAPGADEDREGEPFVGRAGQLLNAMLCALGLQRSEVYIANILKCRPPKNRDPLPEEVVRCEPYLKRQVALVQPKIILAVGRVAAQNLLKTATPVGKLRGRQLEYADTGIPVVVTYHPAYLLRSPRDKRKAWQDLRLAKRILANTSS